MQTWQIQKYEPTVLVWYDNHFHEAFSTDLANEAEFVYYVKQP